MLKILLLLISSFTAIPMFLHLSKTEKKEMNTMLNYSNEGLEFVPKELLKEDSTTVELNLSDNNIKIIPKEIGGYKILEVLDLSGNNQLEIGQSFYDLAKIKTLKEINLSQCELVYIPFSIHKITNLEVLNISGNHLFEIPDMMHKMHQLKEVNLSNNKLKELGYAPSLWKELRFINLKNNPSLDVEKAFKSLSYLNKLERIEVNNLEELPQSITFLKAKEIVFEECSFKKSNIVFPENSKIESMIFDNCKATNFNKLLPVIASNKELKELVLVNNDLKGLSIDSIQFPKLERLDITGNSINEKDLTALKKQFPNCTIKIGGEFEKQEIPEKRAIKAPFEQAMIEPEIFTVSPEKKQVITTTNSKIIIPKDAFVDKDGNIIKSPVSIKYKEILNTVDQILSGIPMEYDSAGVTYNFESAGMIEFRAESQGKEVFPNPNALISVELKSEFTDTNYGLYSMDDETGKWDYRQPAVQKENSQNSIGANIINADIIKLKPTLKLPSLKHNISRKRASRKNYTLKVMQGSGLYYKSLKFLNKSKLKIDYKEARILRRDIKRYHKEIGNYLGLDSTELVNENLCFGYDFMINKENDVFDLTIHYLDSSLTVSCRLRTKYNKNSEQKNYLRFWESYNKVLKKEGGILKKRAKEYELKMYTYESRLQKYQDELRTFTGALNYTKSYTMNLPSFGVFNWDRLPRFPSSLTVSKQVKRNRVKVAIKNIGKTLFIPVILYILDKKNNSYLNEQDVSYITYDEGRKYSLLFVDADGKMATVDQKSFNNGVKSMEGFNVTFETEIITKEDVSRSELFNKLL